MRQRAEVHGVRVLVVGAGAAGARAARQVLGGEGVTEVGVVDTRRGRAEAVAASFGPPAVVARWDPDTLVPGDVAVLALPAPHAELAADAVARGAHVVSVSDDADDVRRLLDHDAAARRHGCSVVVGGGFAPGYSCVLARHAAAGFDSVDEVHLAKAGTGGPACAAQHHRALAAASPEWRDGAWQTRRGGSGRELCWFPEPIGAQDCYRAGLPDPLVLAPAFPGVARVTARVAASRRDRLTARLPMLRRPHPEGLLGALRVEVRGRRGPSCEVRILGVVDRPAVAAGMVAGVTALWAAQHRLGRTGAGGLAELVPDPVPFLQDLARRGLRAATFEGGRPAAAGASQP